MKKILTSLFSLGVVAVVAFAATQAFFSDTETSTGNVLQAGVIDLQIDNESYVVDYLVPGFEGPTGNLVLSQDTTWDLRDLTVEKFFNFFDLKPGDWGEDTISVHVDSNDSWACAQLTLTEDADVDYTEPELSDDTSVNEQSPLTTDGELPENLSFFWWPDDGDNVLEADEALLVPSPFFRDNEGALVAPKLSDLLGFSNGLLILADSTYNFFTGQTGADSTPMPGNEIQYIGKAWCFGNMSFDPYEADDDTSPLERPDAILCNGESVDNAAQTDRMTGDLTFYAVQARNNANFQCTGVEWPETPHSLRLENKDPNDFENVFTQDGIFADLTWKGDGSTFDFSSTLVAQGLEVEQNYSLIYYADPWPGNNPGALLGSGTSDASGDMTISANPDLNTDIPNAADTNHPTGGKIWLVLSSDYDSVNRQMTAWQPARYLFETNLIQYNDTDD